MKERYREHPGSHNLPLGVIKKTSCPFEHEVKLLHPKKNDVRAPWVVGFSHATLQGSGAS